MRSSGFYIKGFGRAKVMRWGGGVGRQLILWLHDSDTHLISDLAHSQGWQVQFVHLHQEGGVGILLRWDSKIKNIKQRWE